MWRPPEELIYSSKQIQNYSFYQRELSMWIIYFKHQLTASLPTNPVSFISLAFFAADDKDTNKWKTYPTMFTGSFSAQPQMRNGKTVLVTCSPHLMQPFASQRRDPSHGPMASKGGFPPNLLSRAAFVSFSPFCFLGASAQETLIFWRYYIYLRLRHQGFCSLRHLLLQSPLFYCRLLNSCIRQ